MTQLQALHWFADQVANEHVVFCRERDDWAMHVIYPYPYMVIPKDFSKNDEWDRAFRQDFVKRCPLAKGFSNVTISVLHELGHHFNRQIYIDTPEEVYENATGWDHFKLPCEIVATNWAIAWLQDKTHRQLAKAFERKFFRVSKH